MTVDTKDTKETKDSRAQDTQDTKTLACGCRADTTRDFLGRVVGRVVSKGERCTQALHAPGQVVVMPGREHARPE